MLNETKESSLVDALDNIARALDGSAWGCMPFDTADRLAQDGLNRIAAANRDGLEDIAQAVRDGLSEIATAIAESRQPKMKQPAVFETEVGLSK